MDKIEKEVRLFFEDSKITIRFVINPKDAEYILTSDGKISKASDIIIPAEPNKLPQVISSEENFNDNIDVKISELLLKMGFPTHIKGYQAAIACIKVCMEDESSLNAVTKKIYPQAAKDLDTTSGRLERALRHIIEVVYSDDRHNNFIDQVVRSYSIKHKKPTNSEFIGFVVDYLKKH